MAKNILLLIVVGYWTGKLLRKLREKYGLMYSVQCMSNDERLNSKW